MAGRRGSNEGSIYKRPDGRWCGQVDLGWQDGKRQRKYLYGKTRADVAGRIAAALADLQRGIAPSRNERLTVQQFLESWLADTVRPSVRPRTFDSYRQTVRDHILPTLGKVPLVKLTPAQVQALLSEKSGPLSPRSVAYIRAVLRIALNLAVEWGMVPRNAAALAKPPKQERHPIQPMAVEQLRVFMGAVAGDRNECLYLTAALCGLRKGELMGLKWSDVDMEQGTLTVRLQAQRINGAMELVPPKTDTSRRTVNIPVLVVDAMKRHRVRQLEERLASGPYWTDIGLVFPSTIGTIADSANITHAFHDALLRAGLPRQRFHDLRHLAASLMLAGDVNPKVMQEVLGHSAFDVTMDLYSHLMPAAKKDAAKKIDDLLTGTD
jgi:integrase